MTTKLATGLSTIKDSEKAAKDAVTQAKKNSRTPMLILL